MPACLAIYQARSDLASGRAALLESQTYAAWVRARSQADFEAFAPHLSAMIDLRKEILKATKPDMDLYDGAIDNFDPRMQAPRIAQVFDQVKTGLAPMIKQIAEKVEADPALNDVPVSPVPIYSHVCPSKPELT